MSIPRNTAIVRVNMGLLEQLLHIPDGHRIVAARQADDLSDTVDLRVEGPSLPAVDAHQAIPRVQLVCTVTETIRLVRERIVEGKFS